MFGKSGGCARSLNSVFSCQTREKYEVKQSTNVRNGAAAAPSPGTNEKCEPQGNPLRTPKRDKTTPGKVGLDEKPPMTPRTPVMSQRTPFVRAKGGDHILNKRIVGSTPASPKFRPAGVVSSKKIGASPSRPTTRTPKGKCSSQESVSSAPLAKSNQGKDLIVVEVRSDLEVSKSGRNPSTFSVTSEVQLTPRSGRTTPIPMLNRSRSATNLLRGNRMTPQLTTPKVRRSISEVNLNNVDTDSSQTEEETEGEKSQLTVGVRVRPLLPRELGNCIRVNDGEIRVISDLGMIHQFSYDCCFCGNGESAASQELVFDKLVSPLIDTAFQGYNACLFAYGQTGSGKSYSMMGPHSDEGAVSENEAGIIPRFCKELLNRTTGLDKSPEGVTVAIEISYLEVYNEKIRDLLTSEGEQLKVREHPVYGPMVINLSRHQVNSVEELQTWIEVGNRRRSTAATEMNDKSSRSHSLFTVVLTQTFPHDASDGSWNHDQIRRSQINLVDLAGSERISNSCLTSDRIREGVSINRSLLTLGKVITALVEQRNFVPYRESVLTWLLKESLGGNSKTTMLATVSPCNSHIDETLATLRYASQARAIVNRVKVNEAPQDKVIRELKAEIEELKKYREELEKTKGLEGKELDPAPPPFPPVHEELIKLNIEYDRLQEQLEDLKTQLLSTSEISSAKDLELQTHHEKVAKLETQIASLSEENETLKKSLSLTQEKMSILFEEVTSKDNEADYNMGELMRKTNECQELSRDLTALKEEKEELKAIANEAEEEVKKLRAENLAQAEVLESTKKLLQNAQEVQQKLLEEKHSIIKVLEDNCVNKIPGEVHQEVLKENEKLKNELKLLNERLAKKAQKVEELKSKVSNTEDLMTSIVKNKCGLIRGQLSLEAEKEKRDLEKYENIMNSYYPNHWEHLLRKARTLASQLGVPYDFELQNDATVLVRHLILSAKTKWNHLQFTRWLDKLERDHMWSRKVDKDIPWEVDFSKYLDEKSPVVESSALIKPNYDNTALTLGTQPIRHGCICPREWKRTLVRRHLAGIKEDTNALLTHFSREPSSPVIVILNNLKFTVEQLDTALITLTRPRLLPSPE